MCPVRREMCRNFSPPSLIRKNDLEISENFPKMVQQMIISEIEKKYP